MTDDDVARLLELRIRRISAYDLDKSRAEEAEIDEKLKDVAKKLRDMKGTVDRVPEGPDRALRQALQAAHEDHVVHRRSTRRPSRDRR